MWSEYLANQQATDTWLLSLQAHDGTHAGTMVWPHRLAGRHETGDMYALGINPGNLNRST